MKTEVGVEVKIYHETRNENAFLFKFSKIHSAMENVKLTVRNEVIEPLHFVAAREQIEDFLH